jgi:hypothetical protein
MNGANTSNILAALAAIIQLAPQVAGIAATVQTATSEGRDLTDDELAAAVAGDQQASDAVDAWLATNPKG